MIFFLSLSHSHNVGSFSSALLYVPKSLFILFYCCKNRSYGSHFSLVIPLHCWKSLKILKRFSLCGLYLSIFAILEIKTEDLKMCINPFKVTIGNLMYVSMSNFMKITSWKCSEKIGILLHSLQFSLMIGLVEHSRFFIAIFAFSLLQYVILTASTLCCLPWSSTLT